MIEDIQNGRIKKVELINDVLSKPNLFLYVYYADGYRQTIKCENYAWALYYFLRIIRSLEEWKE